MVMESSTKERVTAFGVPNLFGVGYNLFSHLVGYRMLWVGVCGSVGTLSGFFFGQ